MDAKKAEQIAGWHASRERIVLARAAFQKGEDVIEYLEREEFVEVQAAANLAVAQTLKSMQERVDRQIANS